MTLSRRRVTSPAALKALAHPLRLALLEVLVTDGPKTATQAALLVQDTPSNCSWHLRKLAEHGFVRESPSSGGRARPWRVVSEGLTWDSEQADTEPSAADEGLADLLLDRELQRFRAARSQRAQEPAQWREATVLNHAQMWLTAEETMEIGEQIGRLFQSRAQRRENPALRPDGARLVSLVGWVVPTGRSPTAETARSNRPD
ncbi:MAG TPA: helix-turn-helix domain-containing protein [Nocardioidaceae bacterium]|nr:helix-turn-helix domain-containing protein [Nocardioidaceae bacterium]